MTPNEWSQSGELYIWGYQPKNKNYSGWHLTASEAGASALLSLLDAFESANQEARRTILLAKPGARQFKVPNYSAIPIAVEKLVIAYAPENEGTWEISAEGAKLSLLLDKATIPPLRAGLLNVIKGNGDYSIGPKKHQLWFWWQLKD